MNLNYQALTKENFINQNPLALLKIAFNNIIQHPVILFPTITLAFIQFLFLEILYFYPQKPLVHFMGPLIKSVWSEECLHYPQNLVLLPKILYYVQIFIYLFIGAFLLAVTAKIVSVLNDHPRVNMRQAFKETFSLYIHIFVASLMSYVLFQLFASSYVKFIEVFVKFNAFKEHAYFLQKALVWTIPYFQFIFGILASALVVYIVPIIVVEKCKIFRALLKNFSILYKSFLSTIVMVGLPTLLYLPILGLRNNIPLLMKTIGPEVQILVILIGLIISMFIDLLIVVSATTFYLFIKENS